MFISFDVSVIVLSLLVMVVAKNYVEVAVLLEVMQGCLVIQTMA